MNHTIQNDCNRSYKKLTKPKQTMANDLFYMQMPTSDKENE